jgi:hypothetical protein
MRAGEVGAGHASSRAPRRRPFAKPLEVNRQLPQSNAIYGRELDPAQETARS